MADIDENSVLEDEANIYGNDPEPGEFTKNDANLPQKKDKQK
jgi:hypothetical protein